MFVVPAAYLLLRRRVALKTSRHDLMTAGPNMMMLIPSKHTAARVQSHGVGWIPSARSLHGRRGMMQEVLAAQQVLLQKPASIGVGRHIVAASIRRCSSSERAARRSSSGSLSSSPPLQIGQ